MEYSTRAAVWAMLQTRGEKPYQVSQFSRLPSEIRAAAREKSARQQKTPRESLDDNVSSRNYSEAVARRKHASIE